MNPLSVRQKLAFLAFALTILCLSLGASLYLLWPAAPDEPEPEAPTPEVYRHVTLSDARHLCETRVREEFGERVWVLVLDKLSTRMDRKEEIFKVFMEVELFPTEVREGPVRSYYVNCFTALHEPRIVRFQYSDDGDEFVVPGEEETGAFGL